MRQSLRFRSVFIVIISSFLLTSCSLPFGGARTKTSRDTVQAVSIGVLPPGMTSPFHTQIAWGAESAGKQYGYRMIVSAPPNETDVMKQVHLMHVMVKQHLSAIAINPMSDSAINADVMAANRANIPVILYNELYSSVTGHVVEHIGYNQWRAGYLLGQYAIKLLHHQGDVLILDGIPSYYTNERVGGFKDALKTAPKIHIVEEVSASWLRDLAERKTTQALQLYPSIQLVFGASDEMAIGAAIAAANEGKKVFSLGIDGNPVTLYEIRKGLVTATIGTFPKQMGQTLIGQFHKVLIGKSVPAYLETPTVLVTKRNVEAYEEGLLWKPPLAGKEEVPGNIGGRHS